MPTESTPAPVTPEGRVLRVLIAEEREADVLPLRRTLSQAFTTLDALAIGEIDALRVALENGTWDVILVAVENQRCRADRIIEILAEDDSAVAVVLLDSGGSLADSDGSAADAGYARVPKDDPARLIEAVERAVRVSARGQGRRQSDQTTP